MIKKRLALVLVGVFCLSLLAGCGSTVSNQTTETEVVSASTTEAVSTTTEQAPVTLNYTQWGNPVEKMNPVIDLFKKENSNISINYSFLLYQDYVNKLKIDFAAGTAPDCADFQVGGMVKPFISSLEPLTPFVEKAWGANWQDKFNPITVKQTLAGGKELYAVPVSFSLAGNIFVYKAKLDKYNLKMPTNMAELKTVSDALRAKGEQAFVIGAKDTWIDYDQFAVMACDVNKDKYYGAIEGTNKWNDPDLLKAFAAWQNLFTNKIAQDGALGVSMYPNVVQDNWQKKAIGTFLPCGDWNMEQFTTPALQPIADQNLLTVAAFPDVNGDGMACPVVGTTGQIMGINKAAKPEVKDAAFKWITFLVAGKGFNELNKTGYVVPAFKDVKMDYTMSDVGKAAVAAYAGLANNIAGDREIPYPEVSKALGDALQKLAGGKELNATIDALQAASEKAKRN